MAQLQRFDLSVRASGSTCDLAVSWSLDTSTFLALLIQELSRLGQGGAVGGVELRLSIEGRQVFLTQGTVREVLRELGVQPDPSRALTCLVELGPAIARPPEPAHPTLHGMPAQPVPGLRPPPSPPVPQVLPPQGSTLGAPGASAPSPFGAPLGSGFPTQAVPPPIGAPMAGGSLPGSYSPVPSSNPFATPSAPAPLSQRRATVDYFSRMNPRKVFPLKVLVAPWTSMQPLAQGAARAVSESFNVVQGEQIEIEPVLPGCAVYPPRLQVSPGAVSAEAVFWVVPQVEGEVPGVVYLRHAGQTRSIPLKVKVVEARTAKLSAGLSLALPYVSSVLKHYHLDFDSQLGSGFSFYQDAVRFLLRNLGPTELFVCLAIVTAGLWAWARPRRTLAEESAPEAALYAH